MRENSVEEQVHLRRPELTKMSGNIISPNKVFELVDERDSCIWTGWTLYPAGQADANSWVRLKKCPLPWPKSLSFQSFGCSSPTFKQGTVCWTQEHDRNADAEPPDHPFFIGNGSTRSRQSRGTQLELAESPIRPSTPSRRAKVKGMS